MVIQSLTELALGATIKSFPSTPFRAEKNLRHDIALSFYTRLPLPTNENVGTIASYIQNNDYWKRASNYSKGRKGEEHGLSYKRMFFEMTFKASGSANTIRSFADYIYTIKLGSPRSEIPFDVICSNLPNLTNIDLKHASGLNLKESIPNTIASSSLTKLVLTESLIRNKDIIPIVEKLAALSTLLHLDLSHNNISFKGTKAIADTLLSPPESILACLDLSGNNISSDGASAIGKALATNESLLSLTLRLNNIGDEGAKDVFEGLAQNTNLRFLDMSANKLTSAAAILQSLEPKPHDCALETVILTSNAFSMEESTSLHCCKLDSTFIDVRTIACEPEENEKGTLASESM
jgi:hypothetical protein